MPAKAAIPAKTSGGIAFDTDVYVLEPALTGAAHLLFADRNGIPPEADAVRKVVMTVVAGALREPPP